MIREPLILPMMMYGKFKRQRAKRDKDGNTIIKRRDAKGRPVYEKENYFVIHREEDGDPGIYPSVNAIYARTMNGRQKLNKPAEQLKEKWEAFAHQWVHDNNWKKTKKQKVVVELTAYFPNDNITRDVNNVFKLMMDAFTDIIYDDDEYALPRVIDFHNVNEGEKPYFVLNIFLKEEETISTHLAEKE